LFELMSLLILPAWKPGNRVAQQLDHYEGRTSGSPVPSHSHRISDVADQLPLVSPESKAIDR